MRQAGLESGGEFSPENIAFKLLRRNEIMGQIGELMDKTFDKSIINNSMLTLGGVPWFNSAISNIKITSYNILINPFEKIGKASYSIYLWHCLLYEVSRKLIPNYGSFVWLAIFITSILVGFISYEKIEKKYYTFSKK